jgi:hypothetical protein
MKTVQISRRVFLQGLGIALCALPLGPALIHARRASLTLHMDRLLVSVDGHDLPYEPRGIFGGARALASLSDSELRARHPYL